MDSAGNQPKGFCEHISFSNTLRKKGMSNETFEVMLSALTLEEVLALKLECSSRLTDGKMYGFNLWSNVTDIVKEAVYTAAISVAKSPREATRILGIQFDSFYRLRAKYNVNDTFKDEIE